MLRPSVSRQEYGLYSDWLEACEIASIRFYGSLSSAQINWMDTFGQVPPRSCDIEQDIEVIRRAAA